MARVLNRSPCYLRGRISCAGPLAAIVAGHQVGRRRVDSFYRMRRRRYDCWPLTMAEQAAGIDDDANQRPKFSLPSKSSAARKRWTRDLRLSSPQQSRRTLRHLWTVQGETGRWTCAKCWPMMNRWHFYRFSSDGAPPVGSEINFIEFNARGCSLKKILVHPQENSEKFEKKSKKSKDFFEDLKSVHFILEWTTPRVFKSFFIYKILVHQTKFRKIRKIQTIKGFFFEDLKSVHLIWEWTTPRFNIKVKSVP